MWLVYALAAAIVWGLDYALGEQLLKNKISPLGLLTIQMIVGGVILLPFVLRNILRADLQIILSSKTILYLLIAAIVSFNLGNFLIFLSVQAKNATLAGLIELCYPLATIFFTWILFHESHVNPGVIAGGLLIFSGVGVIYYFS